jgi:hypothetical protein
MAKNQKSDPTVGTKRGDVPEYPEGTHPVVSPSEATWGPGRFSYSDLEEDLKPDPSTVASQVEPDPIQEDVQEALRQDAEAGQKRAAKEAESNE